MKRKDDSNISNGQTFPPVERVAVKIPFCLLFPGQVRNNYLRVFRELKILQHIENCDNVILFFFWFLLIFICSFKKICWKVLQLVDIFPPPSFKEFNTFGFATKLAETDLYHFIPAHEYNEDFIKRIMFQILKFDFLLSKKTKINF